MDCVPRKLRWQQAGVRRGSRKIRRQKPEGRKKAEIRITAKPQMNTIGHRCSTAKWLRLASLMLVLVFARQRALAFDYAIGADVSFLRQAVTNGVVFKDNGQPK